MAPPDNNKDVKNAADKDTIPMANTDNNEDVKIAAVKDTRPMAPPDNNKDVKNAADKDTIPMANIDNNENVKIAAVKDTRSIATPANNEDIKNAIHASARSTLVNVAGAAGSISGPGTAVVAGISAGVVYDATHSYIKGEPQGVVKDIRDVKEDIEDGNYFPIEPALKLITTVINDAEIGKSAAIDNNFNNSFKIAVTTFVNEATRPTVVKKAEETGTKIDPVAGVVFAISAGAVYDKTFSLVTGEKQGIAQNFNDTKNKIENGKFPIKEAVKISNTLMSDAKMALENNAAKSTINSDKVSVAEEEKEPETDTTVCNNDS